MTTPTRAPKPPDSALLRAAAPPRRAGRIEAPSAEPRPPAAPGPLRRPAYASIVAGYRSAFGVCT